MTFYAFEENSFAVIIIIQSQMQEKQYENNSGDKIEESQTPSKSSKSLQSEVFDICQSLTREYDSLSPHQVRQRLQRLLVVEQECQLKRESRFNEVLGQKLREAQLQQRETFEKMRIGFDLEAIRFEKKMQDKAFELVRACKLKQLDLLINMSKRFGDLKRTMKQLPAAPGMEQFQDQFQQMHQLVSDAMKENGEVHHISEEDLRQQINNTHFDPIIKDLLMQQAQNQCQKPIQQSHSLIDNSFAGVTSGDGFHNITSGSIVLSPQTTSPNVLAVFSNRVVRQNNSQNNFGDQDQNRQKFIYDLPSEFPFNDIPIRKSFSNSYGCTDSQHRSSSQGIQPDQNRQDVDPRDVLRTYTNSRNSGQTLGGLASNLTYYKEQVASREWSNMSPSNAYQNYLFRKNLVSEVQKLARELNKIPTEEARILADLSRSKISQDAASRAHLEKLRLEEEAKIREQAKRIVDGSATRLDPLMKEFTDVPLQLGKQESKDMKDSSEHLQLAKRLNQRYFPYSSGLGNPNAHSQEQAFHQSILQQHQPSLNSDQFYTQKRTYQPIKHQELWSPGLPIGSETNNVKEMTFDILPNNANIPLNQTQQTGHSIRSLNQTYSIRKSQSKRSQSVIIECPQTVMDQPFAQLEEGESQEYETNFNETPQMPSQFQQQSQMHQTEMSDYVSVPLPPAAQGDPLDKQNSQPTSKSAMSNPTQLGKKVLNQTFDLTNISQQQRGSSLPASIVNSAANPTPVSNKLNIKKNQIKLKDGQKPVVSRENRLKVKLSQQQKPAKEGGVENVSFDQQPSPLRLNKQHPHLKMKQPSTMMSYDQRADQQNNFFELNNSVIIMQQQQQKNGGIVSQQQVPLMQQQEIDDDFKAISANLAQKSRVKAHEYARTAGHQQSKSRTDTYAPGTLNPDDNRFQGVKSAMSTTRRNTQFDVKTQNQAISVRVSSQPPLSGQQQQGRKPIVRLAGINFQQNPAFKKPSLTTTQGAAVAVQPQQALPQESPYMHQQKVVPTSKRVVHLKRPSTSMQSQSVSQTTITMQQTRNSDFVPLQQYHTQQTQGTQASQTQVSQSRSSAFRMKKTQQNSSISMNHSVGQDSQHSLQSQNYQQHNNYITGAHQESTASIQSRNQMGQHQSSLRMTLQDI